MATSSSNQGEQAGPTPVDCKGGTTTKILLALAKGVLDIHAMVKGHLDLPDATPALRQSAIAGAEIAKLSGNFFATVEWEIKHSLDFLESIQNKLKDIGTSASKSNSDELTRRTSPLIKQEEALTQQRAILFTRLESLRSEFEAIQTLVRTTPDNPEIGKSFKSLHDGITDISSRLNQIRTDQRTLARDLALEEKTAVHFLPESLKQVYLTQLETRDVQAPPTLGS